MKRQLLTTTWIEGWAPTKNQEIADRGCPGLTLRGGPSGRKTFYRWGYVRAEDGARKRARVEIGPFPSTSLDAAHKEVHDARELRGQESYAATVGSLLDLFIERGQASAYTAALLRKHLEPIRTARAATLEKDVLGDLVAKVQKGYRDGAGRLVGGPAVADKVRGGLRSLFAFAQRQGKYPADRLLPTLGLVKGDFGGIGWQARERVPSEGELHRLLDALGVGTGADLEIDLKVSPQIPLATRLAVLLLMHVPVRSGVGLLAQPASAADLKAMTLGWATHKGGRDGVLATPLSNTARGLIERLRELPGGDMWLVPSPEDPDPGESRKPLASKTLARLFKRLQSPGPNGEAPRVAPDKGQEAFVPHTLRALWASIAGDLGIHDGVAVRVIGHKPMGASEAHSFYDHSKRLDLQREAVELVSAELERIRRREPKVIAAVLPMADLRAN
jgi:hypothetical protein